MFVYIWDDVIAQPTICVEGAKSIKHDPTQWKKMGVDIKHELPPYCPCGAIQSPGVKYDRELRQVHHVVSSVMLLPAAVSMLVNNAWSVRAHDFCPTITHTRTNAHGCMNSNMAPDKTTKVTQLSWIWLTHPEETQHSRSRQLRLFICLFFNHHLRVWYKTWLHDLLWYQLSIMT